MQTEAKPFLRTALSEISTALGVAGLGGDAKDAAAVEPAVRELARRARAIGRPSIPVFGDQLALTDAQVDFAKTLQPRTFRRWLDTKKNSKLDRRNLCALVYFFVVEWRRNNGANTLEPRIRQRIDAIAALANVPEIKVSELIEACVNSTTEPAAKPKHWHFATIKYRTRQTGHQLQDFFEQHRGLYRVYRHPSAGKENQIAVELFHLSAIDTHALCLLGEYYGKHSSSEKNARVWQCTAVPGVKTLSVHMWSKNNDLFLYEYIRIRRAGEEGSKYLAGLLLGIADFTDDIATHPVLFEKIASTDADVRALTSNVSVRDYAERGGVRHLAQSSAQHRALMKVFSARRSRGETVVKSTPLLFTFNAGLAARRMSELFRTLKR